MQQYPIAIYPSVSKCRFVLLGSLLFFCFWLVAFTQPELELRWLSWVFLVFSVLGSVAGVLFFALRWVHKPLVWIYPDRVASFMPIKNRYETLALGDVETFLVWRNQHLTCIVAKCYGAQAERSGNIRSLRVEGGGLLNLWNNPEQKVLNINSALVADIDDICALLNRTLEVYRAEEK